MRIFTKNLAYALIPLCGSVMFGSTIAYGSATLNYIKVDFGPLSTFEIAAFQSLPAIVSIFAPHFWNFLLARFKLKNVTSAVGISGLVFWALLLLMNKKFFWFAIVMRGFHGVTLAGVCTVCPLYFGSLAPDDSRGFFGSLHAIGIAIGYVTFNLIGATHKWQYPIYGSLVFLAIFGFLVWVIPDQFSKGRIVTHDDDSIKESIFDKKYRRTLIISMIMMFCAQFSGTGSIIQNIAPLLSEVGLEIDAAYQASIALSAQLFMLLISCLLMDKFGGRNLWLASSFGTTVSLLVYALNLNFSWSRWLPMIALFGYQLFFGLGLASVPWYLLPENFPEHLKRTAQSIGTSMNWLSAAIMMFLFPYLNKWLGQFGVMLLLMGINILVFLFGFFFVIEPQKIKNSEDLEVNLTQDIDAELVRENQAEL